jgi:peptidoglycan/LPS O-acetylase OafA/YrhL
MLQSVVSGPIPFNGPLWSLSPEWWHYMVAPQLRKLPTAALFLLILASFLGFMFIHPPNGGIETLVNWRVLLVSSWMWVTGFVYFRLRRTPLGFTILAFPATLALALNKNWGLPLFFSIFVLILSTEVVVQGKLARFFDFMGDVSYPLYLFHLPALIAMLALGMTSSMGLLIGPLALAVLVLYMIDLPLRSKFSSRKEHEKVRVAAAVSPIAGLDEVLVGSARVTD